MSATVLSSVTLTNSCTQPAGFQFGIVPAGQTQLTDRGADVCRFDFSSSNDSAQLRLGASDAFETAMTSGHVISGTGGSPNGDNYTGTAITGASLAYGVRGTGGLQRSTDAGMTWSVQGPGVPYDWAGMTAPYWVYDIASSPANGNILWAVGGPGYVTRSMDGGLSWERVAAPSLAGMEVSEVEVVDDATVFIVGNGGGSNRVLRTTNGAAAGVGSISWDVDAPVVPSTWWISGMDAADASNVWLSGPGGSLLRSTNGGSTWYEALLPGVPNQMNDVEVVSPTSVVAVGQNGRVRVSSNATATPPTWSNVSVPNEQHHLRTIAAVDSSTWFVAGPRGALHRTVDAGASWTRIESPIRGAPRELSAWSSTSAILGASGRRMAATSDGLTWTVRDRGSSGLLAGVAAISGTKDAVAVGEDGDIRRSTDLGATYSPVASPVSTHLNAVSSAQAHAKTLFAAGAEGTVVRSTDGGLSWSSTAATGTTSELFGIAAATARIAYAVGRSGRVVATRDGGSSWSVMPNPTTSHLRAVAVVGTDTVLAVAENGRIYRSTNGGSTWSAIVPPGWGYTVISIDVADGTSVVWAGTGWDQMLRSLDGGATWTVHSGTGHEMYGVAAASADVAYFSTYSGKLGVTSDAGATWTATSVGYGANGNFWDIDAVDGSRAMGVGDNLTTGRVTPALAIADYDDDGVAPDADWAGGANVDLFGVCLQAVGVTTTPVWGVDGNQSCTASDTDPWRAVPNGLDVVATTSGAGVAGRVDLVWGFRPAATQLPGAYAAGITVEVLAPNA